MTQPSTAEHRSAKEEERKPSQRAFGEEGTAAGRGVVWIVDDSPTEAEMARQTLAPIYETALFADGASLLERLGNNARPDALVLDWQLPGMSGIEVCRFLRDSLDEIALPIVMLTVHGHKPDIVEGLAAGANDYVTKPYDPTELLARVGTLVRTRRLHERAKRAEQALAVERDRLAFLARASVALTSSLDSRASAESVARLAVPALADFCGFYVRDGSGDALRLVAEAHTEVAGAAQLHALVQGYPLNADASHGALKVLRMGCSDFVPDVAAAIQEAQVREAAYLEAIHEIGVTSWMMVPLGVQGRTFGCLAFASFGPSRRYGEDDLTLVEELGHRAAVAVDNARLFEMAQLERTRAEEANRTKDNFLATVSHELRTPLNAILGWTVMLRSGPLPEEKRDRAMATIERNARAQTRLIEDLLDISRIISGKLRLNVGPVQPHNAVEAAIETIRPTAEAKGVRIVPVVDSQVGLIIGDAERLQQVVWNLLANAVKFTPKGGRVHVHMQLVHSEVEIGVTDTGQGIPAAFVPYVFERFRQADSSIARSHGGLGLGLAITRNLVELHGGSIHVESPGEGLGSTFIVRIPVAPLIPTKTDEPAESLIGKVIVDLASQPELDGLHVLVVDDEPDARDLIVSVLEGCKCKVTTASSAAEAIEALRDAQPDVMVSDIGMPGESGYELIKNVRALSPELGGRTPAVALTAYARMEDRTRALLMGFDIHVPKPIEPSELVVVLVHLARRFPRVKR